MKGLGLTKIDWYIIRKFLGTFFFSISLLIVIVLIFDVSEKIDDFIERDAPLNKIIFEYYLNFIPYFMNMFSPLFTFIAVIFFTSKLAMNTEIIAIFAAGVSFKRLMVPYFVAALFLSLISFYLTNFVIPDANKVRYQFELDYIRYTGKFIERDIHVQTSPTTHAYIENFMHDTKQGYNFTFEEIRDTGLLCKLSASFVKWDTVKDKWHLENVVIRKIEGVKETLIRRNSVDTTFPNLSTIDFTKKFVNVATMNFGELREFIESEKKKGNENVVSYEVEKYKRMVDPISLFIFTLIGMALSSRKVRGGMGFHLGFGLVITFVYIFMMQVTTTFSIYSNLPPAYGVWIPNVFFALIGVYLIKLAPK